VYLETTIPSFYHEVRSDPAMVARREWTREWWDHHRAEYEVVTSVAVLDELEAGSYPGQEAAIALARTIPLVSIEPPVADIVEVYLAHQVMPQDPLGDALHMAVAAYHKCDFLLTWNCHHLANANKQTHLRRVNVLLGLHLTEAVTPLQLIGS
jgi:predicted nucleic acid-binding protein